MLALKPLLLLRYSDVIVLLHTETEGDSHIAWCLPLLSMVNSLIKGTQIPSQILGYKIVTI